MSTFEREDTVQKVVAIIAEKLHVDKERIQEKTTFQELGADSLDMVEIIMRIEEVLGIEVEDEAAEKFLSLQDVISYVHDIRTR